MADDDSGGGVDHDQPEGLDVQRLNIRSCPACDGRHELVPFHTYKGSGRNNPWTHFYHCPALLDPVPLCLKLVDGRMRQIDHQVIEALATAQAAGNGWMVAIFRPDSGVVHVQRITHDFPTQDFEAVVRALSVDLSKEAGRSIGVATIKMAAPGPIPGTPGAPMEMARGQARTPRVEDLL